MAAWFRKPLEFLKCNGTERHACVSFVVSTGFHLALLVVCGLIWTFSAALSDHDAQPKWVQLLDAPAEPPRELSLTDRLETAQESAEGGSPHEALFAVSAPVASVPNPPDSSVDYFEDSLPTENLLEEVVAAGSGHSGEGAGTGQGTGQGAGKGFFGAVAKGKSFVFVVDRSRSMNFPHPSPARTRFKRLKIEILRAVQKMDREQQFFIIFFSDKPLPMPARAMPSATNEAKQQYLFWVSQIDAEGRTNPEEALGMALAMKPDVIYFLTDGAFSLGAQRRLLELKQERTQIHTFAFGNNAAESLMKTIAAQNGGDYKFIP